MRAPLLFLLLAASGCILGSTRCAKETTIELLSAPIKLRYGQVHNTWQEPIDLPDDVVKKFENGTMALVDYMTDIVYENGSRVPLYESYNVDEFPEDVVYGKFVLTFLDDDARELGIKETTGIGHDVTGSLETRGNIEFDVPQCENGTLPEDCIYEQSTVMYADGGIDGSTDGKFLIPYTVGHLHVGGIDISLYDDSTGELICRSEAIYGNGTEPANEENYIVGMTPCYFDDPPVFNKNDKFRIVSRYNNTKPHFGVMSLFLSTSHEIDA